jgi:hypothetical protein
MAFIYVQFWGPPTLLNDFYLGASPLRPANLQTSMSQQAVHHEDEEIGNGQQRISSTSSQETASTICSATTHSGKTRTIYHEPTCHCIARFVLPKLRSNATSKISYRSVKFGPFLSFAKCTTIRRSAVRGFNKCVIPISRTISGHVCCE